MTHDDVLLLNAIGALQARVATLAHEIDDVYALARRVVTSRIGLDVDNPALYAVAREACHHAGLPWTDPRTGVTYPPPRKP